MTQHINFPCFIITKTVKRKEMRIELEICDSFLFNAFLRNIFFHISVYVLTRKMPEPRSPGKGEKFHKKLIRLAPFVFIDQIFAD
jgi:hypothetical protein